MEPWTLVLRIATETALRPGSRRPEGEPPKDPRVILCTRWVHGRIVASDEAPCVGDTPFALLSHLRANGPTIDREHNKDPIPIGHPGLLVYAAVTASATTDDVCEAYASFVGIDLASVHVRFHGRPLPPGTAVTALPDIHPYATFAVRDVAYGGWAQHWLYPVPYDGPNTAFLVGEAREVVWSDMDALTREPNDALLAWLMGRAVRLDRRGGVRWEISVPEITDPDTVRRLCAFVLRGDPRSRALDRPSLPPRGPLAVAWGLAHP